MIEGMAVQKRASQGVKWGVNSVARSLLVWIFVGQLALEVTFFCCIYSIQGQLHNVGLAEEPSFLTPDARRDSTQLGQVLTESRFALDKKFKFF